MISIYFNQIYRLTFKESFQFLNEEIYIEKVLFLTVLKYIKSSSKDR